MSEKIKLGRPAGFFDVFERRPGAIKIGRASCRERVCRMV